MEKRQVKAVVRIQAGLIIGMVLFLFQGPSSLAQSDGAELFEKNCAICHKISGEKLVGPGLLGVTDRRDEEWLRKFISNSQALIESGDKDAVAVFNENNKIPMPAMPNLSEEDITAIIGHIREYDPEAEKKPMVADVSDTDYPESAIMRGERLFKGLIPFENNKSVCASCHNTNYVDTINWNPSAWELSQIHVENGPEYIANVLNSPSSRTMSVVHAKSTFTEEEIYFINAYLHEVSKKGLEETKFFPTRLMIFLGLGFLMTLALIDLLFTKYFFRFRLVHYLLILAGILWQVKIVSHEAIALGRTKDYQPDQPIKFSHQVHAQQNQIDCKYCHYSVDYSKSAGIPEASLCLNCHNVVKEAPRSGKFEINKIYRAIEQNKPIEWIRVHNLPEHAFFSHAQHVNAGKVECATCHGAIETMDIVKQVSDLSMGWCINCHRETKVQFTDNEYYETYMKYHDEIKAGKRDFVTVEDIGGLDCMKCHY